MENIPANILKKIKGSNCEASTDAWCRIEMCEYPLTLVKAFLLRAFCSNFPTIPRLLSFSFHLGKILPFCS